MFTHKFSLALFAALLLIVLRTVYRYNSPPEELQSDYYNSIANTSVYAVGGLIIYIIIHYAKSILPYTRIFNFIVLSYMIISVSEIFGHKYLMHCNTNSYVKAFVDQIPYLKATCKTHIDHHLNVNPDMSVRDEHDDPTNDAKFRMGWNIYIPLTLLGFVALLISKYITNYTKPSTLTLLGCSALITFLWEYLWNKTHAEMHDFEYQYSISKGPYDENLFKLSFFTQLLYTNHKHHHQQKGEKKGNYNVIFLGGDEWLSANNKIIDNTEYCKTHKEEKACSEAT